MPGRLLDRLSCIRRLGSDTLNSLSVLEGGANLDLVDKKGFSPLRISQWPSEDRKAPGDKLSFTVNSSARRGTGPEGGENKHKLQCPRIKEQRELYKERNKEEAEEIDERMTRERMREVFEKLMREEGATSYI